MRNTLSIFALFLLSRSLAQFGPLQPVDTIGVQALLVTDLDSDGDGDLLATTAQGLHYYRNLDGTGDFGTAEILLSIDVGDHVVATCADLDGDGDNDLLFGRASDSTLNWMPNVDGLGTFGAPIMVTSLPAPLPPSGSEAVRAADITGDGVPEAIAYCSGSSTIFWCAGQGGTFGTLQTIPSLVGGPVGHMDLADMDGDGPIDLLLYDPQGEFVIARNAAGDGSIWDPALVALTTFDCLRVPDLIDVDADGDVDIGLHGTSIRTLRNGSAQGLPWPSFSLLSVSEQPEAGEGAYGHLGCGPSASVVHFTTDTVPAVRWRQFASSLDNFGPSRALPDVALGERILLHDLDGDGLDDLILFAPGWFGWYRCGLPDGAPSYSVTMPPLDTLCQFGGEYILPFAAPAGGSWSGPWTTDSSFLAGSAWAGAYALIYQVFDSSGCSVAGGEMLHVIEMPVVSTTEPGPWTCPTEPVQFSATPGNGIWFGPVDSFGLLDIGFRPFVGEVVFVHIDPTGASCASVGQVVEVWDIAPMTFLIDTSMCLNEGVQTIVLSGPSPGYVTLDGELEEPIYVQPNVVTAQFDPSQGVGTYTVQAFASGGNLCPDSIWTTITVHALPEISLTPFDTLCSSSGPYTLEHASPTGGAWSGFGVFGDVFEVATPLFGNYILSYAYTDTLGCSANATQVITAISMPSLFGPEDSAVYCTDGGPVQYFATPANGSWSAPLDPITGLLNPADVSPIPFQGMAQYTYTDPTGGACVSDPLHFAVLTAPIVSFELPQDLLFTNSPPLLLSGGLPFGGAYTINGTPLTQFDPAQWGPGVFEVLYTIANGPCEKSVMDTLFVVLDNGLDEQSTNAMHIWPNPAASVLVVSSGLPAYGLVRLSDPLGRGVIEEQVVHWPLVLDVSMLAPGHYSLLLFDGSLVHRSQVLIQR